MTTRRSRTVPGTTVPGTTVPGTTVPGTTVPGTTVPGTTVPGTTVTRLRRVAGDAGMATAEYAIATLAAVGFAGLLVVILKGNEVKGLLTGIVRQALGG